MERRTFIKNTIITSAGLLVLPYISKAYESDNPKPDLISSFLHPPDDTRPWAYWMWMNGNITLEGITLDLEAMKRMGIGGVMNFNAGVGIPRGLVDYASADWDNAVVHAAKEAERLGIIYYMHNSPGYSGCGGAWITPDMSMQELVWTGKLLSSDGVTPIKIALDRPYAKLNYYRDAMVIAYSSLAVEQFLMKDKLAKVLLNGKEIDKNIVTDGNPDTMIRMELTPQKHAGDASASNYDFVNTPSAKSAGKQENIAPGSKTVLLFEFSEPFESRSISIYRKPEVPRDLFDGARDIPPILFLDISDDGLEFRNVGHISCVELRKMDTPSTMSFDAVKAKFYRLSSATPTWIGEVELYNGPRLGGWSGKTSHTHGSSFGETPALTADMIIDPKQVIDISNHMNTNGTLEWNAPQGRWTILRIGHTTTGEIPAAHPDAGDGLEIDMFNKQALDLHFEKFLDPLLNKAAAYKGKSFQGFTVDSWEAGKSNWTAKFPEEFKLARKYNILGWMPAMTGRIVGSVEQTERFLWDIRRTHADLLANNFYGHFQECCHKRGLGFNAEPYGDGVFDSLQSGKYLDFPMSEFWTRYIYGGDSTSMLAASLAHVYGKKVAAAESYTAMPLTSKWTDYPYSLKAEGDYFFSLGINRMVFHAIVHQPYKYGKPGMTYGPFGTHFDRNNTWAEQVHAWTAYIKRSQYLLQQGLVITDVCYFKGDSPESGVPSIYEFMPDGYAGDIIGPDAFARFEIKNGQITLPDGMVYTVCVMARLNAIELPTLEKIKRLVADGMTLVVSNKPIKTYGLTNTDDDIKKSIDELYGNLDGENITEYSFGKGRVIWTNDLKGVLTAMNVNEDFLYTSQNPDATIHYIHKKMDDMEYYFVTNHRRQAEKIQCSFRLSGLQPELWNSQTGEIYDTPLFDMKNGRTSIALELGPVESVFIVFRKKITVNPVLNVFKDGKQIMGITPFPLPLQNPYSQVKNSFTIALWAKPDTFVQDGRSMLFHPPQGEKVYGTGHAAMGLGAGQNGVMVYERLTERAKKVLASVEHVEGWTHIAVVYDNGKPSLYLNGKLSCSGTASGAIIHPGIKTPSSPDQYDTYFEGNYTQPQLYTTILSEADINSLYGVGLPPLALIPDMEIKQLNSGKLETTVYSNGKFIINSNNQSKVLQVSDCRSVIVKQGWDVTFPDSAEMPAKLHLPELISLIKHPDFNVRHFSGTAIYHQTLHIPVADITPQHICYLDLGRVEVIAQVKLNGKDMGVVWKEPYRIDITKAIKPGNNRLEISVTNLWPNRLIGDDNLPEENTYSVNHYIEKLPDWYVKNEPKPGERSTFVVWKNLTKDDPLLESGLLGPVKLIYAVKELV